MVAKEQNGILSQIGHLNDAMAHNNETGLPRQGHK